MEPIESLSLNHQNDGEESSEGLTSVAVARSTLEQRPEAVRVAVQTQKADAELGLRVANAEARISASEQMSERESTRAAAEAAEEEANVEVQQLENQEAESRKNAPSAALQEIEEAVVS